MTVTTNERGQQNLFAREPRMYVDQTAAERYGYETYAEKAEKLNGRTGMLGFGGELFLMYHWQSVLLWNVWYLMENSLLEILTYYVIGGALLIGALGVFFFIVFQPASKY